ncbi:hypothetical protein V5799_011827 [Amblyomma americanum]|uniref:Uncharacterized protein n=1 Tax=Amblyomma americanum TaxID=6943 RepID=A0AAQ4EG45_AMBAM
MGQLASLCGCSPCCRGRNAQPAAVAVQLPVELQQREIRAGIEATSVEICAGGPALEVQSPTTSQGTESIGGRPQGLSTTASFMTQLSLVFAPRSSVPEPGPSAVASPTSEVGRPDAEPEPADEEHIRGLFCFGC